ncbi:peroxisomal membrane protein PEX14-like isoform X2 [Oculina patagonica]
MVKEKEMRQKRIDTAVKFLQNPKVRETPMSQRKAFLEKKGLKKDEVEEAIRLSGTAADETSPPTHPPLPPQRGSRAPSSSFASAPPPPPVPWRSYVGAAILGGGIGYTVAHLFKTFILPYIYHKKSKEEEKLEKIETTVTELKGNMVDTVQKSLDSVQGLLEQQQTKLHSLALDLASTQSKVALLPSESYTVGDLKGEILSLKGLLLNRKQFPSPMVGSTPSAPSIPAWQRTVTSTERTRTTSSLTDSSENPGATELSDSKEQSSSKVSSLEHSSMNGDFSKDYDNAETEANIESQDTVTLEYSPASATSSSGTDTANTPNTVVAANDKSLNDAMLNDTSVLSSDASLSSMSDLSGNTSFHETSIAFSSTCIKAPSDMTLPSDSTLEFEGVNDSVSVAKVQ